MTGIRVINQPMSRAELKQIAAQGFGDMVKAAVDIQKRIMAIGGELHSDEEKVLLEQGSHQADVWGINLYPDQSHEAWIEFDAMINIRPQQGNRSRSIADATIQKQISAIVEQLVQS